MADAPFRAGPQELTLVEAVIVTVPVGSIYTVRNIHVCNSEAAEARFTLSIGADAVGTRIYRDVLLAGNGGVFDWSGYMPLDPGEDIRGYASLASAMTVTISGVDTT